MKKRLHHHILVAGITVLLSAGALLTLLLAVRHTQTSIAILTETISASSTNQNSESLLAHRVEETQIERRQIDAYFADVSALVQFLEAIEGLARVAGVSSKVEEVAEGTRPLIGVKSAKVKTYKVLDITVSFEGAWDGAYRFLSLVEHIPYANTVEHAELKKVDATEQESSKWKGLIIFTVAQSQ